MCVRAPFSAKSLHRVRDMAAATRQSDRRLQHVRSAYGESSRELPRLRPFEQSVSRQLSAEQPTTIRTAMRRPSGKREGNYGAGLGVTIIQSGVRACPDRANRLCDGNLRTSNVDAEHRVDRVGLAARLVAAISTERRECELQPEHEKRGYAAHSEDFARDLHLRGSLKLRHRLRRSAKHRPQEDRSRALERKAGSATSALPSSHYCLPQLAK